jgi:hypothetical protein
VYECSSFIFIFILPVSFKHYIHTYTHTYVYACMAWVRFKVRQGRVSVCIGHLILHILTQTYLVGGHLPNEVRESWLPSKRSTRSRITIYKSMKRSMPMPIALVLTRLTQQIHPMRDETRAAYTASKTVKANRCHSSRYSMGTTPKYQTFNCVFVCQSQEPAAQARREAA